MNPLPRRGPARAGRLRPRRHVPVSRRDGQRGRRARRAEAEQAGIPVVFATGRPVRWLGVIADLPGAHQTVIASNGAVLYDLGSRQALDRLCLDRDVGARRGAQHPRLGPGRRVRLRVGHRLRLRAGVPDLGPRHRQDPTLRGTGSSGWPTRSPAVKMLVQSRSLGDDALLARVQGCVGATLTATMSTGRGHGLVELSARGVDKASMLPRTCARRASGPSRRRLRRHAERREHAQLGRDAAGRRERAPRPAGPRFPGRAGQPRVRRRGDDPRLARRRRRPRRATSGPRRSHEPGRSAA